MTATRTARAAEHELRRRVDSYLVRRGRAQTTDGLQFVFGGERRALIHVLVQLERAGKVVKTRHGWEATQAP